MSRLVKYNLTPENKHIWNELGFNTDASNTEGVGTFDWSDTFVDDNFGWVIHELLGFQIYERKDLNINPRIKIEFEYHYEDNKNLICLIKDMFDKGLLYIEVQHDTK